MRQSCARGAAAAAKRERTEGTPPAREVFLAQDADVSQETPIYRTACTAARSDAVSHAPIESRGTAWLPKCCGGSAPLTLHDLRREPFLEHVEGKPNLTSSCLRSGLTDLRMANPCLSQG